MERIIFNRDAQLSEQDKQGILETYINNPGLWPEECAVEYFNGTVDYTKAARLFFSPIEIPEKTAVKTIIARSFFDLAKRGLPNLRDPYRYTKEEATSICSLYTRLNELNDPKQTRVRSSNPFDMVMSLKFLSRKAGIPTKEVIQTARYWFTLGNLQLRLHIRKPDNTHIKKAIHDSVHNQNGAAFLERSSIPGNVSRIENNRRIIALEPSLIDY